MAEWYEILIPVVSLITASVALGTLYFLRKQMKISEIASNQASESFLNSKKASEIDVFLRLSDDLQEEKFLSIAGKIAGNVPILVENGGTTPEEDLVRYLYLFTNIFHYLEMEILDPFNTYNHFGNYAIHLNENKEITNYIETIQKKQDPHTWGGIQKLAEIMKKYVTKK